jgi:hypothetical protein
MTHDLIGDLLRMLDDVSVLRVVITKLEQETTPPPPPHENAHNGAARDVLRRTRAAAS